jgi:hypothetical protein
MKARIVFNVEYRQLTSEINLEVIRQDGQNLAMRLVVEDPMQIGASVFDEDGVVEAIRPADRWQ